MEKNAYLQTLEILIDGKVIQRETQPRVLQRFVEKRRENALIDL